MVMGNGPIRDTNSATSERIVVGIDGSEEADRALRWAAEEARCRDVELHVVHTFGFQGTVSYVPVTVRDYDEDAVALLHRAVEKVHRWQPSVVVTGEAVLGPPGEVLAAESDDASLLVVGSRGRGAVKRVLLGSVSQDCAHRSRCAVTIVR